MFANMLEALFFSALMWLNWVALSHVSRLILRFGEEAKKKRDQIALVVALVLVIVRLIYTVLSFSWLLFRVFQCAMAVG